MEVWVLLSNCLDDDLICVDTRGGGVMVEFSVDTIASFGGSNW